MNDNKSTRAVIGPVRFSYLHVFEPWKGSDGKSEPKYSVSLIIPKDDTETLAKIKAALTAAFQAGISAKWNGVQPPKGTWRNPLRDGDIDRPADEAYKNYYFINATAKTQPGVVKINPAGDPKYIKITDPDEIYSGCYGYASINFFAFNNAGNKGISAGLNNLLKTSDGEFLGGRSDAASDFNDIKVEDVAGKAGSIEDEVF